MEKRQYSRVDERLISQIHTENINLFAMTGNLSANGLFLRSRRCLPVNSIVKIQIVLPDNSVSSLQGIVRRAVDTSLLIHNGMGIHLTEKDSLYTRYLESIRSEMNPINEGRPHDICSALVAVSIQEETEEEINPSADKRQSPRYILPDKQQIEVMIGSSEEVHLVDISTGGLSFKTEKRLDQDKQYVIQMHNKEKALTLQGAVRWRALHEYRKLGSYRTSIPAFRKELLPIYTIGIQFTNLFGHTSDEIVQFVDGLTKFASVHQPKDYISLSDLLLSDANGN